MKAQREAIARAWSARVERLTARERALVAVLSLFAADWVGVTSANLAEGARVRLREAQGTETLAPAKTLAGDARNARAWAIGDVSDNIAQIRALAIVEEAAQRAGLSDVNTSVETAPSEGASGARIVIALDGAYEQAAFGEFLARLGETEESLTPIEVEVDKDRRRLRMRIVALHIQPAGAS